LGKIYNYELMTRVENLSCAVRMSVESECINGVTKSECNPARVLAFGACRASLNCNHGSRVESGERWRGEDGLMAFLYLMTMGLVAQSRLFPLTQQIAGTDLRRNE
jgi:hypothetical protein